MRRAFLCALALLALFLSACAREEGFDAGEPLSAEELQALKDGLFAENAGTVADPAEGDCYYTESGTVYHFDPECSYLSHARQIHTGTVEQAIAHGALRGCSRCVGETETDSED